MLNKKELAEEFSYVVQQEIRNHNDAVLATNVAIEDLRKQIVQVYKKFDEKIAKMHSDLCTYRAEIIMLKDQFDKTIKKYSSDVNDKCALNELDLKSIVKKVEDREINFTPISDFNNLHKKIDKSYIEIKNSFDIKIEELRNSIYQVYNKLCTSVEDVKNDLHEEISEESESRKTFENSLNAVAVNFAGYQRELEICKKRCFVIEKNMENIYTIISRKTD
jgi:hypothetical protein